MMLNSIPKGRLLTYIFLIGMLPFLIVSFLIFGEITEISSVTSQIETVKEIALMKEKKQEVNKAVISHHSNFDKFYIDKHLESITPLVPEIKILEKIAKQNNFIENEEVISRLDFLKNKNKLVFAEGVVQSFPGYSETIETLVYPVEINQSDLQNILSKIEGVQMGPYSPGPTPPQLIITEFKLDKKSPTKDNDVFQLTLKLLKREYS